MTIVVSRWPKDDHDIANLLHFSGVVIGAYSTHQSLTPSTFIQLLVPIVTKAYENLLEVLTNCSLDGLTSCTSSACMRYDVIIVYLAIILVVCSVCTLSLFLACNSKIA